MATIPRWIKSHWDCDGCLPQRWFLWTLAGTVVLGLLGGAIVGLGALGEIANETSEVIRGESHAPAEAQLARATCLAATALAICTGQSAWLLGSVALVVGFLYFSPLLFVASEGVSRLLRTPSTTADARARFYRRMLRKGPLRQSRLFALAVIGVSVLAVFVARPDAASPAGVGVFLGNMIVALALVVFGCYWLALLLFRSRRSSPYLDEYLFSEFASLLRFGYWTAGLTFLVLLSRVILPAIVNLDLWLASRAADALEERYAYRQCWELVTSAHLGGSEYPLGSWLHLPDPDCLVAHLSMLPGSPAAWEAAREGFFRRAMFAATLAALLDVGVPSVARRIFCDGRNAAIKYALKVAAVSTILVMLFQVLLTWVYTPSSHAPFAVGAVFAFVTAFVFALGLGDRH